MLSLEEIVGRICSEAAMAEKDVNQMIEAKVDELSGLVSKEGAAYIVGRELGVHLIKDVRKDLKIKNLVSGLRSVDLKAKVVRVFEPREFDKNGKKGSVMSVIVGDETATTRLSLWNDEIKKFAEAKIAEGDVIKITGGYAKDGLNNVEISLGKTGKLEKIEEMIEIQQSSFGGAVAKRTDIKDVKENEAVEIRGYIAQLFQRVPFYNVCSQCGGKVEQAGIDWICKSHGKTDIKPQLILSGVIDDGTGNIRAVFFREAAEKMAGHKTEELAKAVGMNPLKLYSMIDCLGKEFLVTGKARKSDFSGEVEFTANAVEEVDVKKECEILVNELKG